jgi:hypothetical protein
VAEMFDLHSLQIHLILSLSNLISDMTSLASHLGGASARAALQKVHLLQKTNCTNDVV